MKTINTSNAPKAIGPYSQGVDYNQLIFTSGQIPLDPKTMELVKGEEEQIRQVFKNIQSVCKTAGVSLDNIVKLNVYLADLSVFSKVNEVMKELFSEPYPARAAIQVAKLPLDSLIEVEGIIVKK